MRERGESQCVRGENHRAREGRIIEREREKLVEPERERHLTGETVAREQ